LLILLEKYEFKYVKSPSVMNIHEVEQIINSAYHAKSEEKRYGSYTYAENVRNIAVITVNLHLS
jgi:hypothetical protein